ncbi:hypothetical protein Q5M85_02760 [Paraclostridium bifermentans]|nr:hypothetical protein [Paraclostridium bifermentans]
MSSSAAFCAGIALSKSFIMQFKLFTALIKASSICPISLTKLATLSSILSKADLTTFDFA